MRITQLQIKHLRLPAARQRISLTSPETPRSEGVDLIVADILTDSNVNGLGFAWTSGGAFAVRSLLEKDFPSLLVGEDPLQNERLLARVQNRFRPCGWPGLVARAYAAIDIALWDIKGKAAGLPLYKLLGGARTSASAYLSDMASLGQEPGQTLKMARPLIDEGALGLLVEVGAGDIQLDADRVQQIRDGLGENAWLGIAVEGRYDLATALAMAHFYEEDVGIDRYEFPLPDNDMMGYQRLAERMEVPLALGSSFDRRDDFRAVLKRGNIRVLRPDLLRLGGLTPFLKVAALAEAYPVTLTPYRLPEIGVHLACGLSNVDAVDYTGMLAAAFSNPPCIVKGKLTPEDRPGHGLELNPAALERYAL